MTAAAAEPADEPAGVRAAGSRVATLDGLRALAFMSVFLNHAVNLHMAWIGVDLFFVLSGFLITGILLRAKGQPARRFFGHFYSRRVRRILPPYFLVLAVVAIVGDGGVNWRVVWWYFFTFTQNIAGAYQLGVGTLQPYWSLAVEEQFYLLWPLLCFTLSRQRLIVVTIIMICLAPVLRAIATPHAPFHTIIFFQAQYRMDLLAAGALLALVWEKHELAIRARRRLAWPVTIVAGLAFFGPALFFRQWGAAANSVAFNTVGYTVSVILCTSVIVHGLTAPPGSVVNRILSTPALTGLGRISYTCYLVHSPVLGLVDPAVGRWIGAPVALVGTVLFAMASWRWIEAPILQTGGVRLPKYSL